VQGGEDEMAGFRGLERNFDGFPVAHFSNQDYLRRLSQGRPERQSKARGVAVEFPLMNR